jgi:hypothetical protein
MATQKVPLEVLKAAASLYHQHQCNSAKAARAAEIPRATFFDRLSKARKAGLVQDEPRADPMLATAQFTYTPLPDPDISVEELIEHRKKQFSCKQAHEDARKLIKVKVHVKGPFGIWHFGDPHLDDDGTDLGLIQKHVELIKQTEGLFGANVGDSSNNWVGRLSHLWSQQSTSARQMWRLVDWFIGEIDWLYLISGNHDAWSGDGDPIKWMMKGQEAPYQSSEVRLELATPNRNTCRINARHDFSGHSQYNPVHGPMKANMFGVRDHIAVAGHRHVSGHGVLKNPEDGSLCHSFLVAGYKIYDRYAMEKGFRDQRISPGVFTIINPEVPNTHPDFILHCWDIETGIFLLKALRKRYA